MRAVVRCLKGKWYEGKNTICAPAWFTARFDRKVINVDLGQKLLGLLAHVGDLLVTAHVVPVSLESDELDASFVLRGTRKHSVTVCWTRVLFYVRHGLFV